MDFAVGKPPPGAGPGVAFGRSALRYHANRDRPSRFTPPPRWTAGAGIRPLRKAFRGGLGRLSKSVGFIKETGLIIIHMYYV